MEQQEELNYEEEQNLPMQDEEEEAPLPKAIPQVKRLQQENLEKQAQDENPNVLRWRMINVALIALTAFLTIVFLQILG